MEVGIAGEFKWEVRKVEDDSLVSSGDWQPNLILDQCFTEAAKLRYITGNMYLGTGGTAPKVTDTQLENRYNNWHTMNEIIVGSFREGWVFPSKNLIVSTVKYVRRFRPRVSVNLAELGLQMYNGELATRTLFKNASGPTTVTVLPDEYIDIHYRLWGRYDATKITTAIPYKKKSRDTDLESETWNVESKIILSMSSSNTILSCIPEFQVRATNSFDLNWFTESLDIDAMNSMDSYYSSIIFKPPTPRGTKHSASNRLTTEWTGEYSGGILTYNAKATSPLNVDARNYKSLIVDTQFISFIVNLPDGKSIQKTSTQTIDFSYQIKVSRYTGSLDDLKEGTTYAP